MTYPNTSRWDSGELNSAWYGDATRGRARVCQTDGWTFVQEMRASLIQALRQQGGSLPTITGIVTEAEVPTPQAANEPAVWDLATMRALYALAQRFGAPRDVLTAIAADALSGLVSARTLQAAIWIAEVGRRVRDADGESVYGRGSIADVRLPRDLAPPVLNRMIAPPPNASSRVTNCVVVAPGEVDAIAPPQATPFYLNPLVIMGVVGAAVVAGAIITRRVSTYDSARSRQRR